MTLSPLRRKESAGRSHSRPRRLRIERLETRLALAISGVSFRDSGWVTGNNASPAITNRPFLYSGSPGTSISSDGTWVAFRSLANDLAPGDSSETSSVFVKNTVTGETTLVNTFASGIAADGANDPAVSDNGRYVAFASSVALTPDFFTMYQGVYFKDLFTGETTLVSRGTQHPTGTDQLMSAGGVQISRDGRYVKFQSSVTTLLPDRVMSGNHEYVRDMTTDRILLASEMPEIAGAFSGGGVSSDLRYQLFSSDGHIWRRDLETGDGEIVSANAAGVAANQGPGDPTMSADGRYISFDSFATNLIAGISGNNVFVKDMVTGEVNLASADASGNRGVGTSHLQPTISSDGRFVIFHSNAANLVPGDLNGGEDVFLKNLETGEITVLSARDPSLPSQVSGNGDSQAPAASADGRYVVFESVASDLVPGDTNQAADVFLRDMLTGAVTRVSTSVTGVQGNNRSQAPSISADGRFVAFSSLAFTLTAGDVYDSLLDVYVKDLQTGSVVKVSSALSGGLGNGNSSQAKISADGRFVVFSSTSSNLVSGDTNGESDIFRYELATGIRTHISGDSTDPSLSADGRYVAFTTNARLSPADTDSLNDIVVKDTLTGEFQLASIGTGGAPLAGGGAEATISEDGGTVVFLWNNIPYVKDLRTQVLTPVIDLPTGLSYKTLTGSISAPSRFAPTLSADGRYVAFATDALAGEYRHEVYVKDMQTGLITRINSTGTGLVSMGAGLIANGPTWQPVISPNGEFVTFVSRGDNLAIGDFNDAADVFQRPVIQTDLPARSPIAITIPKNLAATAGYGLTIPIKINSVNGAAGTPFRSVTMAIYYDPEVLSIQSVRLGNANQFPRGWSLTSQIDATSGVILISANNPYGSESEFTYALLNIRATVKATAAAGVTRINLSETTKNPAVGTFADDGATPLLPSPTNAENDAGDGLISILAGPHSPIPPQPAAWIEMDDAAGSTLRVSGTAANELILVAPLNATHVRVRVANRVVGDFPRPNQVLVDGQGGVDYIYVDPSLIPSTSFSAGEAIAEPSSQSPSAAPAVSDLEANSERKSLSANATRIDPSILFLLLQNWQNESQAAERQKIRQSSSSQPSMVQSLSD